MIIPSFSIAAALTFSIASTPLRGTIPSGGNPAELGEFPYMVSLSVEDDYVCSGSLLDATTVLTTATCSKDIPSSDVHVRAGSLQWSDGGQQVGVQRIISHPSFNESIFESDIAIWKLSEPIMEGQFISYARLPVRDFDPRGGYLGNAVGWYVQSMTSGPSPRNEGGLC
jgi:trypsin